MPAKSGRSPSEQETSRPLSDCREKADALSGPAVAVDRSAGSQNKDDFLSGNSEARGNYDVPGFLSRFAPHVLRAVVRIAIAARERIAADAATPLWVAIQTGDVDGWNARRVFHRYVWPAPSVPAWDSNPLRNAADRLYLIDRFLADVAPKRERRGGWVVAVYSGGRHVA